MKKEYILLLLCIMITAFVYFKPRVMESMKQKQYEDWEQDIVNSESGYRNIRIFIDIIENRLYVIHNDKVIREYVCASGKYSTPSPIGEWKVINKGTWGDGFGGRWMGLNVPWGTYGIHGTKYPSSIGRAASGGCIRLGNKDAAELYKIVRIGTRVTIYGGPNGPFGRNFRTLKPGDIGSDVLEVQKRLKKLKYYNGPLDGKYGKSLEKAVNKFQRDKEIKQSKYIGHSVYKALGVLFFE